jgi:site-specific DNA-methyltransferase (adenine-specific)
VLRGPKDGFHFTQGWQQPQSPNRLQQSLNVSERRLLKIEVDRRERSNLVESHPLLSDTRDVKTERAPRNRTLIVTAADEVAFTPMLRPITEDAQPSDVLNQVFHQDIFAAIPLLPTCFVDLLILDPPYNLAKDFNGRTFQKQPVETYTKWMESWFLPLTRVLKPTASIYVCGDWLTSASIFHVLEERCIIRNRITWEREKGRGAKTNWKNCSEDIWFATTSDDYFFKADEVMLKRRVLAPYRVEGHPKDWQSEEGGNYRLTHPSNFWSDITVPFWSMAENTDHPTQKPEKLIAKLTLASSKQGDVVMDPFLGSGTTAVVAKKLGRKFVGIEVDRCYCLLAQKRLAMAESDKTVQGYANGVFWERNTLAEQLRASGAKNGRSGHLNPAQTLLLDVA